MAGIQFQCPHCGGNLEVSDEASGIEVACPHCSEPITIPSWEAAPTTVEPPARSSRNFKKLGIICGLIAAVLIASALILRRGDAKRHRVSVSESAEAGIAESQFHSGWAAEEAHRFEEAVEWYRKAAELGNASAQLHLGLMYAAGKGVPKDDAEAVRWLRKLPKNNTEEIFDEGGAYSLLV